MNIHPEKLEEYKNTFLYYLKNAENELYKKYGFPYSVDFRVYNDLTVDMINKICNQSFGKKVKIKRINNSK